MIKRVIFDIDNTLIPWKEEYYDEINKVLDSLNIKHTQVDYNKIKEAFSEYENEYYTFDRKLMLDYINKYTKKQYPKEFIYGCTNRWADSVPQKLDESVINMLKYLKDKYQMVILTDWYADQQIERLEKLNILKYFSKIYSAEKVKRKPFKEAFLQAIEDNKPEECIMIGDNFERDIKGALNAGLHAIYYNPKNNVIKDENTKYYTISRLDEIMNIL